MPALFDPLVVRGLTLRNRIMVSPMCQYWVPGGWDIEQSIALARRLREHGVDLVDCSSGGAVPNLTIPVGPGYQVPLAERIPRDAGLLTGAVGMITTPQQANEIVQQEQADCVLLARELLRDPYFPLRAARELGHPIDWPSQYLRAAPRDSPSRGRGGLGRQKATGKPRTLTRGFWLLLVALAFCFAGRRLQRPGSGRRIAWAACMFHTFNIPISWSDLGRRTLKDIIADDVLGLGAQLAYYFLFALVPSILCMVALTSFLPPTLLQSVIGSIGRFAPDAVLEILREQMTGASSTGGLFTFGLLIALWSSSAAMVGITDALNRAYDIEEARPWWKVRLTAIALTLGTAVFIILALVLVMMGPALVERVASSIGLGPAFVAAWNILRWPVAFVLTVIGIGLVYYFAPDAEQDWEWVTPGAVLATILWLIASLAFKTYVASYADYSGYGSLGGVMVLMLWFYLSALAVLAGAEMNAEVEHASPHGKDPGEKVAGGKKVIGARAARAHEERRRSGGAPPRPSVAAYAVLGTGVLAMLLKKLSGGARK